MARSLIITDSTNNRIGLRFDGEDHKALHYALCHVDPGDNYTIRFTDSNRNLRNLYWLSDGEVIEFAQGY